VTLFTSRETPRNPWLFDVFVTKKIPDSTVRRLSHYLRSLEGFEEPGGTVSSEELAARGQTTAAQVRKDLSHFGSFGKRGLGYRVDDLRAHLRGILGIDRHWRVALVGAGRIGLALFEYPAFRARGYDCVAIFDSDPEKIGTTRAGLTIRDPSEFEDAVRNLGIELVILAVPEAPAQEMAGRAVEAGVKGILNFAPIRLNVPPRVPVEDVNLVMELEALSFAITQAEHDA
jgi:redox-sensing transcriptional repressor